LISSYPLPLSFPLFTIAFAKRVVAVELNKSLCLAAEENLTANSIHNVHVIACDSEVFAQSILKKKSYTRPDTGEILDFRTVLVDPPRFDILSF
jgi:tRNA/tmRNA/rRNA uracil-C5-methylase (TrmA/RlmC/RlmD family)